jgi:hypothetical protein
MDRQTRQASTMLPKDRVLGEGGGACKSHLHTQGGRWPVDSAVCDVSAVAALI